LPHSLMFPAKPSFASTSCSRCLNQTIPLPQASPSASSLRPHQTTFHASSRAASNRSNNSRLVRHGSVEPGAKLGRHCRQRVGTPSVSLLFPSSVMSVVLLQTARRCASWRGTARGSTHTAPHSLGDRLVRDFDELRLGLADVIQQPHRIQPCVDCLYLTAWVSQQPLTGQYQRRQRGFIIVRQFGRLICCIELQSLVYVTSDA
jgi:hypothetical protein